MNIINLLNNLHADVKEHVRLPVKQLIFLLFGQILWFNIIHVLNLRGFTSSWKIFNNKKFPDDNIHLHQTC